METLKTFKKFVDKITESNSRTYKEQILTKYKDDEDIKYYLYFLFNPYITTGISDKKLNKKVDVDPFGPADVPVKKVLEWVSTHNTGSDSVISLIQKFRETLEEDLKEVFNSLITKNLKLGIDSKSINKVITDLIPEFNVQLANKYFDNPGAVDHEDFAVTTKIDGGRIIAVKENGSVSFYTRAGQKYEGLVDLEKELTEITEDNFVLDGEITLLNPRNLVSKEQYKQTMKITRADGEKHGVKMLVFDYLSLEEFKSQKCKTSYFERRLTKLLNLFGKYWAEKHLDDFSDSSTWQNNSSYLLESIISADSSLDELVHEGYKENKIRLKECFNFFEILPILYLGHDTTQILKLLESEVSHGEEGIMINMIYHPYQFKRSSSLLKVKKMQDLDLEVVGFEEGTGRNEGRLGAILVKYKNNIVKVGSGFSDELRKEIWHDQNSWLGRTIVVKYFEETSNQNGGISLRFPVFVDWRDDK